MLSTEQELLLHNIRISQKRWLELVEARVERIKPHLDTFTLIEFGRFNFLRRERSFLVPLYLYGGGSAETIDQANVGDVLKLQGLFWAPYSGHKSFQTPDPGRAELMKPYPDGIWHIYGLTRKGEWVLIEVHYQGSSGYKGRGQENATKLIVKFADTSIICKEAKIELREIWENLGKSILTWHESRRHIYETARTMAEEVKMLEVIASQVK